MHNVDRTLQGFESGAATNGEYENSYANSYETIGELGQEYEYETTQEFG